MDTITLTMRREDAEWLRDLLHAGQIGGVGVSGSNAVALLGGLIAVIGPKRPTTESRGAAPPLDWLSPFLTGAKQAA